MITFHAVHIHHSKGSITEGWAVERYQSAGFGPLGAAYPSSIAGPIALAAEPRRAWGLRRV